MQWQFRKLTYDILIPKLGKSIYKLTEREAAAYFEWYMEQIPDRVAYVSQVCAKELHIQVEKMDCSPESLLLLWKWFRRRAKTERIIHTEEASGNKFPNSVWKNDRQLTLETEYVIRDIGMYLGETFRKDYPNVYWTYYTKPRRDFFVNHPLLKGFVDMTTGKPFEVCFEPIHMTQVQAAKLINNTSQNTDLLKIYNIWAEKPAYGAAQTKGQIEDNT